MRACLFLLVILVAGCSVGPTYRSPDTAKWLPTGWLTQAASISPTIPDSTWWQAFRDPVLSELVQISVVQNYDRKIALERVREARAARLAATSALMPSFNGNLGLRQGNTGGPSQAGSYAFDGSFDASWELDIFGGLRRSREAAQATVGAREAAFDNTHLSLIAETVRLYLDYRRLQEQLILTRTNLKAQRDVERAVKAQQAEGVADLLDVSRVSTQAFNTELLIPTRKIDLATTRNTLAALLGFTPEQVIPLLERSRGIPTISHSVILSLPANVVANRPDVRAAERELAAATANQGVALSNWFPKVTLGGLIGFQTTKILGNVDTWSQGGSLKLPILDFGRVQALVKQADARQRIAYLTYRQTILNALADIESTHNAYQQAQVQLKLLQQSAKAAHQAEKIVRVQYREGLTGLIDVLTTQQRRLETEGELANAQAAVGQRYAALYKALGGGKITE